jgi:hypothetical protein
MKVVVAGGTGLLGTALTWRLTSVGHHVVVLTRDSAGAALSGAVRRVEWTPDGTTGPWAGELEDADAVVNLTGAGIADERWTDMRKEELRSSRVLPARSLVAAVRQAPSRPKVFVQVSGVGFYGTAEGDRALDESFPPGDDFPGRLAVAWEAEAHPVAALGCRLVILRNGVVLTREGGILSRMRRPFRWFVGGPIGHGQQYVSWIHVTDWVGMVIWALGNRDVSGAINATAPTAVTNAAFSRALARALQRPSWLPAPSTARWRRRSSSGVSASCRSRRWRSDSRSRIRPSTKRWRRQWA